MRNLKNYLYELCAENLPSGFEQDAVKPLHLLRPLVDQCYQDEAGNIIGCRKAAFPGAKKLLLDAHLDEIGLVVTSVDEQGFLHFTGLTHGVQTEGLPGTQVTVKGVRPLPGIIATVPPHLQKEKDRSKRAPINEMVIDIGYPAKAANELVRVGDPVILRHSCADLMNDRVTGKALDDRAGVAVILETLRRLEKMPLPVDLYVVFSAGEEFGSNGVGYAAWEIFPDEAIALDVTFATTPGLGAEKSFPLGCGAVIGVAPALNGGITDRLISLAKAQRIPYALEVMTGRTGTNSENITATRSGIPVGLISFPERYMHSGCEVVDLKDLSAAADLLCAYINQGGADR